MVDDAMRLSVPFHSKGLDGRIRIAIHPNTNPRATGHDEVASNFDEEEFTGFPVTTAEVDYPGEGPRGWFAWIQWVKHIRAGRTLDCQLDSPDWLDGPFYLVGFRPTFADAPANPDHLNLDWVATTTYLTITAPPDGDADSPSTLMPLAGFVWGYRRGDAGQPTQLLEPQPATRECWAELTPLLARNPKWRLSSG